MKKKREKRIHERVRLDFIRYSNCWEDADVLLKGLRVKTTDTCFSIASAGDNSLSLLSRQPELVVAVDINPVQLHLVELKIACFKTLSYEDTLAFLGIHECPDRIKIFRHIKGNLSPAAFAYWEKNSALLQKGIIHAGKLERYFTRFSRDILPLIHSRQKIRKIMEQATTLEQEAYFNSHWNTLLWRKLFCFFFGRLMFGRGGRDPEFFRFVKGNVGQTILERFEWGLTKIPLSVNPYLTYFFLQNYRENALPHYLREENFLKIKEHIDRIKLVQGDIEQVIRNYGSKFSVFNLSDIFEYISTNQFNLLMHVIDQAAAGQSRIAYWNMLVDRILPADSRFKINTGLSAALFSQDQMVFYKRFITGESD